MADDGRLSQRPPRHLRLAGRVAAAFPPSPFPLAGSPSPPPPTSSRHYLLRLILPTLPTTRRFLPPQMITPAAAPPFWSISSCRRTYTNTVVLPAVPLGPVMIVICVHEEKCLGIMATRIDAIGHLYGS